MNLNLVRELFKRVTDEYRETQEALVGEWCHSREQLDAAKKGINQKVDAWRDELEKLIAD